MITAPTPTASAPDATDALLVAQIAMGDERALAAIYDRYGRVAFGLAVRVVHDRDLAEEAVQDGFLAFWQSARSFDPTRASARTWLFTLVHRRAVDIVRRRERQERVVALIESPPSVPAAEDDVVREADASRVRGAVRRLAAREREVVELAYFAGLSQSEIASRLGVPIGTVKSRTFTALSRLRQLLDELEPARVTPGRATGRDRVLI
jgi:RNA polymerase sigma factor (sigma-70 family)